MQQVVRTTLANAFQVALERAKVRPVKSRIGQRVLRTVLTNDAKGIGVKFRPKTRVKVVEGDGNNKSTADSAGNVGRKVA